MGSGFWVLAGIAVVAVLVALALGVLLARTRREQLATREALDAEREERRTALASLHVQLDALSRQRASDEEGYLITGIGGLPAVPHQRVSDQLVLSATLGEPLVRAASLGYGVRRALSAPARNRIRFAFRQQVRASRRERKDELREALRHVRARRRAAGVESQGAAR